MTKCDPFEFSAPYVKLVDCRNTLHVTLCDYVPPAESRIDRINDDFYYVRSSEEIRPYRRGETSTKRDHRRSIKRAFNNLKKLINCNYDCPSDVRFITLTYAENMLDNQRIRLDWTVFIRRCRRFYGQFRYIYVKEKQGRGAWHLHCLFFFEGAAPYMANEDVRALWGHGFVRIESICDDVNNLGNYLCAYMTDDNETGKKGSRLLNYEAGVRLYSCSRDVLRPVERVISYEDYCSLSNLPKLTSKDSSVALEGRELHVRYEIYSNA